MEDRIIKKDFEKVTLETIKESFRLFSRFNKFILRYWKIELILLMVGNISMIFGLINPYIGKIVLDRGILGRDMEVFIRYTIFAGIIYLMNMGIGTGAGYLSAYVSRKIRIDLTKVVFRKIRKLSLKFFQERSTGEYIFRMNSDISSAAGIIINTLPNVILTFLKLIFVTIVICFINWKILLLVLVYHVMTIIRMRFFIDKMQELKKEGLEKAQYIFKVLGEFFSHIYFVKSSGTMGRMVKKYFHALSDNIRIEIKNYRFGILSGFASSIPNKLFYGTISIVGTIMVIKGRITLGTLGAIMAYLSQGIGAYGAVLGLGNNMIMNRISLKRLTELLDAKVDVEESPDAKFIDFKNASIEFKNVSFGYEEGKDVLENISFSVPPRSKIALIGHSGCGKTTILNLILRLYDVKSGEVCLGGYNIKDLKFKSIHSQVSMALQSQFLWNESIRDNISYLNPSISEDELRHIAKMVELDTFIEEFPDKYDTILGEEACKISQGQRQRLAIARTLAKRPRILMLDEAFSSIDSETEDKIVNNIKNYFKDSTIILVSHRLSAVKNMDIVYFLEGQGKMSIGKHHELVKDNLNYRKLFASQIEKELEEILTSKE
ncbi:MAG: ABC transporter ATP-binding protein [Candidatus Omnitrophota bacterium]